MIQTGYVTIFMSEHFFTLLIAVYAEPNSKKLPKSNITPFNVYP